MPSGAFSIIGVLLPLGLTFLKIYAFHTRRMKFAEDGCSMFGCLRWGSSDAFGSTFLNFSVWELCFSLVSLLWELCYSLALG